MKLTFGETKETQNTETDNAARQTPFKSTKKRAQKSSGISVALQQKR